MPRVSVRNITFRLASPASKTAGWRPYSSAKTPSFPGPVGGRQNARPAKVNRKRLYADDAYRSAKIGVEERFDVINGAGEVVDTGESVPGWLGISDPKRSLLAMVRHFRPQFPKAMEFEDGRLRISLFEASPDRPHYLPTEGEAKRHEIWLGLWNGRLTTEEMERAAGYFARPSRLFNPDYFCASGGFGYATPHDETRFADLDTLVQKRYGEIAAGQFYVNGIRHWGDKPYGKSDVAWCNGYYDMQQGLASEYLMTGDPRWFDHLEATVRHIMDIDVCHASSDHPDWIGAIHCGHDGRNHTSAYPWNPGQRIKGTLAYWRLTGDVDAREAALGIADSAVRAKRGIGAHSVRDHAGILYCLTAAYDETRDPKYLEAARRVAHDAMGRIDRRRGCYSEVHGNIGYRGNVPWMCAQLAEPMYYYYRQSGDVEAASTVVGLAESILAENRTRDVPGDVYGYSHNPHFGKSTGYYLLIASTVLYAYELSNEEYFLANARAMYDLLIRDKNIDTVRNCYWNTPTLLYYLKRYTMQEDDR